MRKIQITCGNNGTVYTGYKQYIAKEDEPKFLSDSFFLLPDNSCEEIIAYKVFSSLEQDKSKELLKILKSKLRLDGVLKFDFLNFEMIDICNISSEMFNNLVYSCRAAYSINDIIPIMDELGLVITNLENVSDICVTQIAVKRVKG